MKSRGRSPGRDGYFAMANSEGLITILSVRFRILPILFFVSGDERLFRDNELQPLNKPPWKVTVRR